MEVINIKKAERSFILDIARKNSINAAINTRTTFFNLDVSRELKDLFRMVLASKLDKFSKKYYKEQTKQIFLRDVQKLQNEINDRFRESNLFFYDNGFTIGNSQKVLSVYLKYLWCLDIIPMPPVCPLDRVMLTISQAPYNKRSWGKINSIDEYLEKYSYLEIAAKKRKLPPPVFELLSFAEDNSLEI